MCALPQALHAPPAFRGKVQFTGHLEKNQCIGFALKRPRQAREKHRRGLRDDLVGRIDEYQVGRFPAAFAAKNDLSLDFLVQEVLDRQERDVALLARCAAELEGAPALHALAEEILGNAKGHLDVLREVIRDEGLAIYCPFNNR